MLDKVLEALRRLAASGVRRGVVLLPAAAAAAGSLGLPPAWVRGLVRAYLGQAAGRSDGSVLAG